MSLRPPPVDRRSFDDLVSESLRRLVRYAPEYTDHNESDPGVALIQVFAWLAQLTQEKVNELPERAYRELLALVGLELEPARPAEVDVVFTAAPGEASGVPAGTSLDGGTAEDGSPIVFQTTEAVDLVPYALEALLSWEGSGFRDHSAANAPGEPAFDLFGERPQPGAALYFGFAPVRAAARRVFPRRMSLRLFPEEGAIVDDVASCSNAAMVPVPRALAWEYLPSAGAPWRPLEILADETRAGERGGFLMLEGPGPDIEPALLGAVADPLYWLRLRVVEPAYGRVPRVELLRFNAARARNEVRVRDELVGRSDGRPDQAFSLHTVPVVAGTLLVQVEDAGGDFRDWTQVEQFGGSGGEAAARREFLLDPAAGRITFGDGRTSAIPVAGSRIRAHRYRGGGGARGNVPAGTITTLLDSVRGVDQRVEQPRRAIGGKDEQSVDDAVRTAPARLRAGSRAVTESDYASAAREVAGVGRADVLALAHPAFPGVTVPGAVTVLVAGDALPPLDESEPVPVPAPSQDLLRVVCSRLNERRLLTTELFVRSPVFVRVDVWADLVIDPLASAEAVKRAARARLNAFLHPLRWELGREILPVTLYHELLELQPDGLRTVSQLHVRIDGRRLPSSSSDPTAPIPIPRDAVAYAGDHELTATPGVERP